MKTILSLTMVFVLSAVAGADENLLAGAKWVPYAQREALMPKIESSDDGSLLALGANGRESVNGSLRAEFPVKAGEWYRFHAEYKAVDVKMPRRSVLVCIDWLDKDGQRMGQPEFPANQPLPGAELSVLEGVYAAPEKAERARVDLVFRWSETGFASWKNIRAESCAAPQPRKVKLATVNYRSRESSGPRENLERYGKFVAQAGEQDADIVCLPEGITVVGTTVKYVDASEPLPGPSTEFLGQLAKQYSMYIVAGIYEKAGETVYNTSVLLDRDGKLAGRYRKAALPREEIEGGITPGDDYPVFKTDFGTIGMMICWDVFFVEPARCLAQDGAEIVFLPIWGGNEELIEARAIENQVFLVTSSYDARTAIRDRTGKVIAEAKEDGSVAVREVDLNERTLWPWLGDFRARIGREAPVVHAE